MKKAAFWFFTAYFFFFFLAAPINASLLVIQGDGKIIWNVLSDESQIALEIPKSSFIEVKKVARNDVLEDSFVSLTKDNEKISLVVRSDNEDRELNLTGQNQDIIEIEERPETQKVVIGLKDSKFSLEQKGIVALTEYPIQVDAKSAKLSVTTESGNKFLSILPYGAVESVLRAKIINRLSDSRVEISESGSELQYKISGEKVFNLFNIFEYAIPVTAFVSASTGEVLLIDSPTVFKYLKFLFV